MYLLCTSFFATHVLFHLQSPFFIPDLFTGRVFEAQSFCYGESALVNSCRDLVLPDNSAGQRYIGEEQSRRVKLFLTPPTPKCSELFSFAIGACQSLLCFDFDWSSPRRRKHPCFVSLAGEQKTHQALQKNIEPCKKTSSHGKKTSSLAIVKCCAPL